MRNQDRSFWCRVDGKIKLSIFWLNEAVKVIESTEAVEAVEVIKATEILRPGKSLLRTPESARFLNSALI